MKRVLIYALVMVLICSFTGCAKNNEPAYSSTDYTTIDYSDAESFEASINNGEKVKGKIVKFHITEYVPDSIWGVNCHAGEHLNFLFEDEIDVEDGDIIIVRITQEPLKVHLLDSWKIHCMLMSVITESSANDKTENQTTENSNKNEIEPTKLSFLDDFTQYGYDVNQIKAMRTILLNVGINEINELEIGNVSYGMQVVKGLAFTTGGLSAPQEVHVQFNIENGVIYLVAIYCPSYGTSSQPTYLKGLEDRRADLYYDVEGGYIKKIDWENKTVVDYE